MLIYECSTCGGRYNSNSEWFHHLIKEEHQKWARREMLSWSGGLRASVIVVFGKHPVGWNSKIVEKLSKDGETVVLDFVWWEERPKVGFVQFQNRETVSKVIRCLEDERFQIEDQVCQVMDGGTIAGPEWKTLFPANVTPSDQSVMTNNLNNARTNCSSNQAEINNNANQTSDYSNNQNRMVAVPPKRVKLEPIKHETGIPSCSSSSKDFGLRHHLAAIRKLIEIPDEEYYMALDITRAFQQTLGHDENRGGAPIRASLSRHWILKLQYCPNEDLKNIGCGITISCIRDPAIGIDRWLCTTKLKSHMDNMFNRKECSKRFPHYIVEPIETDPSLGMGKRVQSYRFTSRQNPSRHFPISTVLFEGGHSVELQTWNLAKYLCTFDPRCYPVMSLLYYWAQTNSVIVGKQYDKGIQKDLADPCGLTWLLIFFFQREGLIPSTKEIQQQPHELVPKKRGIDIGFAKDPDFPIAWKITRTPRVDNGLVEGDEKFAGEVFQLLYKFFGFCDTQLGGATKGNGLLLNTRDAEMLSLADMIAGTRINSKLKWTELNEIKASFGNDMLEPILMLNPFMLKFRISMVNAKQAFVAMRKTAMQMNEYFGFFEEGHCSAGQELQSKGKSWRSWESF